MCSSGDAELILTAIAASSPLTGSARSQLVSDLEEQINKLTFDHRNTLQRLERRDDEIARLKSEVGEARQRLQAVEAQSKSTIQGLSQRREEVRKQLLTEEGRNAKLQFQVKTLQQEAEKLKERIHELIRRK